MTEPWNKERGQELIQAHRHAAGATLPILHAMQEAFGCVPEEAIPLIADALNLSHAEVYGIVSFYRDFRSKPPGRHVLKLCRAEACQAMGGDALAVAAEAKLSTHVGDASGNGTVTLEPVYCLGLCACAPAALFDGKPFGRLNRERLEQLLDGTVR
jgi:formate dehydrogenase subunit gamma